ncbi:hypothetical protein JW930_01820 [Candidatus Woesearchaeota archaeon]|nr:hypothetical protein [Candidatus Woesearchaeota archaeon]
MGCYYQVGQEYYNNHLCPMPSQTLFGQLIKAIMNGEIAVTLESYRRSTEEGAGLGIFIKFPWSPSAEEILAHWKQLERFVDKFLEENML